MAERNLLSPILNNYSVNFGRYDYNGYTVRGSDRSNALLRASLSTFELHTVSVTKYFSRLHACFPRKFCVTATLCILPCMFSPPLSAQDTAESTNLNRQWLINGPSDLIDDTVDTVVADGDQDVLMESIVERLQKAEARLAELDSLDTDSLEKMVADSEAKSSDPPKPKSWFEKYRISGYTQFRINETLSEDSGSAPAQHVGDSSVGDDQGFIIRRARLVLQGDVTDRISLYFQPDFAANVPGSPDNNHFVQLRDWYSDLHFDKDKVYRIRVGQSKIPYGWENMQSSRNRLPLDRNDAFNSAVRNERDLGAFFYWTPQYAQDFFDYTLDEGLKGSGNYGVFGIGVYNGQGGSLREQNDNLHLVSRLTLPITFRSGQLMELGVQGYTGKYTVLSSAISPLGVGPTARPTGTLETGNVDGIRDERIGTSFVYYPQPFGFQSEWTVGRGPGLSEDQTAVNERALYGGYGMFIYRHQSECYGEVLPFARWSYFKGGYKTERNAPFSEINEFELGVEWQMTKNLEFVSMYTITDRTNTRAISTNDTLSYSQFDGDLLRFQLQVLY